MEPTLTDSSAYFSLVGAKSSNRSADLGVVESTSTVITWCLVNYKTGELVTRFAAAIAQGASAHGGTELRIGIADNSPVSEIRTADLPHGATLIDEPSNPGYLPGALRAYEAVQGSQRGNELQPPDWVVISNADLAVPTNLWHWFGRQEASGQAQVIAPQVFCEANQKNLNPHLVSRPGWPFLTFRWLFTRNPRLFRVMSGVAAARRREETRHNIDSAMYASHGTIWIFSYSCFEAVAPLLGSCPLYAEEIAVAEVLLQHAIPLRLAPDLVFVHHPHASTGSQNFEARAGRWKDAYTYLLKQRIGSLRK